MRLRRSSGAAAVAVVLSLVSGPALAQASSSNVAALQVALRAKGFYRLAVDGVRGPLTRAAVVRFQRRRGLATDGVAGPITRRALGRRGRPRLGSRIVHSGQRGWDVAALQFLLAKRGYPPGSIDGLFGPVTRLAVVNYQRALGLGTDGLAGPITIGSLRGRSTSPTSGGRAEGPVRFVRPVSAPLGDGFGAPRDGGRRRHLGLDFEAWTGTPVGAGGVGVVEFTGRNQGGYGNLVVIRHRLGFTSWYAHLSRIAVSPGQPVSGGTIIGYVGSTGNSTGPHLHFEVRRWGTPIDPLPYLLATTASASARRLARGAGLGPDRSDRFTCGGGALVVSYRREKIDRC